MSTYTVDLTTTLSPEEYRARLVKVIDAVRNDPELTPDQLDRILSAVILEAQADARRKRLA